MQKLRIALIFGGVSSEYEISLKSAYSICQNIDKEKYEVYLIGISKLGDFYLFNGDIEDILNDTWEKKAQKIIFSTNRSLRGFLIIDTHKLVEIDLAYPILHGQNGEDGRLMGLFELINLPFVGSSSLSSALCMNKYLAHEIASLNGIKVPKGYEFSNKDKREEILDKVKTLKFPIFIKPLRGGSSIGISKIEDIKELDKALDNAFKYDTLVIIEEEVSGVEVGVSIIGNDNYIIGEVDEVELESGFFDYEKKYHKKSCSILPANIEKKERERIKEVALKLYKHLYCKDYARVDLFYTKDKEIIFNEINTIPGFTTNSRFPKMIMSKGYSYQDIIELLIEEAKNE